MAATLRQRLVADERAFTLLELVIVVIVLGVLLAVAIPSYVAFRGRANSSGAQANIRAAIPGIEAYNADNGTYVGMTLTGLRVSYDRGIRNIVFGSRTATTYCVRSTVGSVTWYKSGPGGGITTTACT